MSNRNLQTNNDQNRAGTVKRYLSELQSNILIILNRHILQSKSHPIVMLCDIFRSEFEKSYKQYAQPVKDEKTGVKDKLGVMEKIKERTI